MPSANVGIVALSVLSGAAAVAANGGGDRFVIERRETTEKRSPQVVDYSNQAIHTNANVLEGVTGALWSIINNIVYGGGGSDSTSSSVNSRPTDTSSGNDNVVVSLENNANTFHVFDPHSSNGVLDSLVNLPKTFHIISIGQETTSTSTSTSSASSVETSSASTSTTSSASSVETSSGSLAPIAIVQSRVPSFFFSPTPLVPSPSATSTSAASVKTSAVEVSSKSAAKASSKNPFAGFIPYYTTITGITALPPRSSAAPSASASA
ncbi:hypothetical protein RQP46_010548 [Phenoliferia psychrophenolica]